jgi:hypothetical protein
MDRCPKCGSVLTIFRRFYDTNFPHCYKCGFELKKAKPEFIDENSYGLQAIEKMYDILDSGIFKFNTGYMYSFHYFLIVKQFVKIAYFWPLTLDHEIMAKTIELYENKPKRNFLEMIPIKQQYLLFSGIVKLLDNFPDSLIMYCIENKLTMTHLIREMQDIPFEYQKIVDKFDKRIYTPHIQEIRNASSYLKKQGRKPSIASVARLVGTRLDIGPARNRDRRREEVLKAVGL